MIYIFYFYFLYFFYIFFIYPLYILFIYIYFIYFIIHNFYFYFYIIFFYSLRAFYGNNSSTAHLTKPTVHKSDLTVKHNECTSPFISLNLGRPHRSTRSHHPGYENIARVSVQHSIVRYHTVVQEESQLEEEGGSEPYRASTVFGLSPAWSSTSAPNNWPDTKG